MGWLKRLSLLRQVRRDRSIDWLFHRFSVYVAPVVIALGTLAAVLWAPHEFDTSGALALTFRVVPDPQASLQPADALKAAQTARPTARFGTHLAETPIWFLLTPPAPPVSAVQSSSYIDLPSRHAQTLACWLAAPGFRLLGTADRKGMTGEIRSSKAGFALRLDPADGTTPILCKGTFSGPAYITAAFTRGRDLMTSALDFEQSAALITGGLLMLAVFVFVTAIINREWTYVIFAAWLVGNLRLSANAMGFDTEWVGHLLPPDGIALLRQFTFAAYYLLTTTLFMRLFRRELKVIRVRWALRAVQYAGVLLMIAALTLDYAHFIPVLWTLGGFGMLVLIYFLAQLFTKARSRTVLWYVASMAIVLFATFSEVLAAAFGVKTLFGGINPVVTALSSSMMAAFALAERMREERDRRRKMQIELRNTYDVTPIGLFTLDEKGRFVRANSALHAMLGLTSADYGTRNWADFFEAGSWDALATLMQGQHDASIELDGAPGSVRAARRYSLKAIRSNGSIEGSLEDVTDRSKAIERLHFLVEHDSLTGLLNRRGVEKAIGQWSSRNRPWALAYIDLDRFKLINDLFGHPAGDEVLKHVASRLLHQLPNRYPIGRIGGDEFVCVLGDTTIESAMEQCRELVTTLNASPYHLGSRAFQVKASIGVVECSHGDRVQDALAHADRACRASKRSGHGRLVVLRKDAPAFEERAVEIGLIEALGQALLPDGLFLVMQPIMSMTNPHAALDFEVLLRLRAADGTVMPAGKLIAAAEDSGNIAAIDRWVLTSVFAWLSANHRSLVRTNFICVNLSGGSLNDEQFLSEVFELFARYEALMHFLCLEITESVALHDLENTQRFISRVHDMGAKIALDDFGAGQTSFKYLKELSADALKIDGAFVRTMCHHPADTAIVEAMVTLARNLGMRSIAEWVEDLDTLRALKDIGVDYVQGFVIAKPQDCHAILLAESAASFVTDPCVAQFLEPRPAAPLAADYGQDVQERTV